MFGPPQVRQIVQLLAYTAILVAEHFFSIKVFPRIVRHAVIVPVIYVVIYVRTRVSASPGNGPTFSQAARARILAVPDKGTRQPEIARNLNIGVGTAGYHVARLRMDGRYKP
jgi:predicted transcriptional regulator